MFWPLEVMSGGVGDGHPQWGSTGASQPFGFCLRIALPSAGIAIGKLVGTPSQSAQVVQDDVTDHSLPTLSCRTRFHGKGGKDKLFQYTVCFKHIRFSSFQLAVRHSQAFSRKVSKGRRWQPAGEHLLHRWEIGHA